MCSRRVILFSCVTLFAGLAACKNNDNVFAKPHYTDFSIINASNDTLNLYVNGTRQNNNSSLVPGGSITHLQESGGAQNFQFKKFGSQSILFGVPLTLRDSVYNSLYVTGESTSSTFSTVDTLLIDTIPNKGAIRFVHTSPNIGSLDVYVGDSVKFRSLVFKRSAPFQIFTTGSKEIKVFQSGGASPLVDTVITFSANRVYTLFSKGSLTGTGTFAFDIGVVQNY